jgi:hypothetical protein
MLIGNAFQINSNMNSNFKLYLYDTTIDLVVSPSSIYVDNKPMNNRILSAHKGVNNEIYFNIRDRDRKLQNVFSDVLRAYLIEPDAKRRILTKTLSNTSDIGIVKLVLTDGDLAETDPGLYQIHITRSTQEDIDLPVYMDQNNNIRLDIRITDQASVTPVSTQEETVFTQTANTLLGDSSNVIVSSALYGNLEKNFIDSQHTIGIYTSSYTGNITIQGSCLLGVPDIDDASKDWFSIETVSLSNSSIITHRTFNVNANWIRIIHTPDSGTVDKVVLRN